MSQIHRLFIAVEVPKEVQKEVERIQSILQKSNLFEGTYTDPQKVHITLKFLGDVHEDVIAKIDQALQTIILRSMEATLSSIGFFATGNSIKVIFLNILCIQLEMLAQEIDKALVDFSEIEERGFVSHMTLARVKKVHDKEAFLKELDSINVKPLSFSIDSFVLKKSVLTSDGPEYFDITRYVMK